MIEITHRSLQRDFAIAEPLIAVAGLNPHAGEEGLFGREEQDVIAPAVNQARQDGIRVDGPVPPDTVFFKAASGLYDAVVCMYHDQGLIPFKLLHFKDGVNVTLGLPIVRTSVDHGTAYDIAGKGVADPSSLAAAIDLAGTISANRKRTDLQP
jgi:4-hydroxythreonine-4-phosphate dehydrogenase